MTALEKKMGVRKVLYHMCSCGECDGCVFFNPNDTTDGENWCGIRDKDGNIPYRDKWDMNSAMI